MHKDEMQRHLTLKASDLIYKNCLNNENNTTHYFKNNGGCRRLRTVYIKRIKHVKGLELILLMDL